MWEGEVEGISLHNNSYATFRAKILLPERHPPLVVAFKEVANSYKLWYNGRLAIKRGKVATNRDDSVPDMRSAYFVIDSDVKEAEIVIQQSAYHHRKAGHWSDIYIGSEKSYHFQEKIKFGIDMFMASCLLIMGLYHWALYGIRRKNNLPALLLGCYLLLISLRTGVANESQLLSTTLGISYFATESGKINHQKSYPTNLLSDTHSD